MCSAVIEGEHGTDGATKSRIDAVVIHRPVQGAAPDAEQLRPRTAPRQRNPLTKWSLFWPSAHQMATVPCADPGDDSQLVSGSGEVGVIRG